MLKLMIKLVSISVFSLLAGCNPNGNLTENFEPTGKAFFDPENRTMLGHKLYDKVEDLSKNPNYTFLRQEHDVFYYTVNAHKTDPRHLDFIVSVRNNKIYSIESRYQYPNFSSCNDAAESIYETGKDHFPLKKQPDISGKGYTFDGISKNFIFITACTDLLDSSKIIHSSIYTR